MPPRRFNKELFPPLNPPLVVVGSVKESRRRGMKSFSRLLFLCCLAYNGALRPGALRTPGDFFI
ncbi:MAG: hypothetical protein A3E08_02175 [Candidatus Wildermuthbacteria bacterium RIFCSPHIGHO2_12_FULL_49_13]|nr:MAG: hypothetical protein A3E08_02175 [Candidatus Wildermuthbacteria bacterium RIFCSPHIGHO2_12_FULL_49_13]OHA77602.1 MAG: hypothetical protein A2564_02970 [Candidatus Wildermuthbacteria bacterium RIFOXYD1_FULL_50_12]